MAGCPGLRLGQADRGHLRVGEDHLRYGGVVGLTESQARAAGHSVRTVEYALGDVSGAALHAEGYSGHAKLVVDSDREVLLGATFVGQDSAELVHAATVALVGEVPISRLWHAVPSFPTMSEVWLRLLEEWGR